MKQFPETPDAAAVNRFSAQSPLVPGCTQRVGISNIKFVLDVEKPATVSTLVQCFPGVLLSAAGFFNTLEKSKCHFRFAGGIIFIQRTGRNGACTVLTIAMPRRAGHGGFSRGETNPFQSVPVSITPRYSWNSS